MCDPSERARLRQIYSSSEVADDVLDSFCSSMSYEEVIQLLGAGNGAMDVPEVPEEYGYRKPPGDDNMEDLSLEEIALLINQSDPVTAPKSIGASVWSHSEDSFCDVAIFGKDGQFFGAHRAVLVSQWPPFERVFEEFATKIEHSKHDKDGNHISCVLEFPHIDLEILHKIFRLIYTGCGISDLLQKAIKIILNNKELAPSWFRKLLDCAPFEIPNFSNLLVPASAGEKYSDFTFNVKSKDVTCTYKLHRCLLYALNPAFHKLFLQDARCTQFTFPFQWDPTIFTEFFQFLYSDSLARIFEWQLFRISLFCRACSVLGAARGRNYAVYELKNRVESYLANLDKHSWQLTHFVKVDLVNDMSFLVDGTEYPANSALLRARVDLLKNSFSGREQDGTPKIPIEIPEMDFDTFNAAIRCIYTARPDWLQLDNLRSLGKWLKSEGAEKCSVYHMFLHIYHLAKFCDDVRPYSGEPFSPDDETVTIFCNIIRSRFLGSLDTTPIVYEQKDVSKVWEEKNFSGEDVVVLLSPSNQFLLAHSAQLYACSNWFRDEVTRLNTFVASQLLDHIVSTNSDTQIKANLGIRFAEKFEDERVGEVFTMCLHLEGGNENSADAFLAILQWMYQGIQPKIDFANPVSHEIVRLAGFLQLTPQHTWLSWLERSAQGMFDDEEPELSQMNAQMIDCDHNRQISNSPLTTEAGDDKDDREGPGEDRGGILSVPVPNVMNKRHQMRIGMRPKSNLTTTTTTTHVVPPVSYANVAARATSQSASVKRVNPKDPEPGSPYSMLRRELFELIDPPCDELLRVACSDDMLHWWVRVRAPANSGLFGEKGSTFSMGLHFTDDYPVTCPTVQIDRIVHPNFDPNTGLLNSEALQTAKGYSNSVTSVIRGVQTLLAIPQFAEVCISNPSALEFYRGFREDYFKQLLATVCNRD